jgi:aminodeoxychorismate lyase
MIVFLNGQFVPEDQATVSVLDRSFLYGDGLFETLLVANATPFRWSQHLARLESGAAFLGIALPFGAAELIRFAAKLIHENQISNALLRVTLSRGVGRRGYSPRGADSPVLVMTLHELRDYDPQVLTHWQLRTSEFRLPANQALAQFKTCNKLAQILARAQAEQGGADEALLANTDGFVVEGASSNLFWIDQGAIHTPPLASGVLSGVTRSVVLELCRDLGLAVHERNVTGSRLMEAEGVFLSLSSLGIVQGASLDGAPLRQSLLTRRIHAAYSELVRRETAPGVTGDSLKR